MANYDYNVKTNDHKGYDIRVDTKAKYGCFEHNELGDEDGGGLWFDDQGELEDFDGAFVLPKEVAEWINLQDGLSVDVDHFCE